MSSAIERISALLIKAERTDNPHEADAYLMKAQALATMASIDIAAARARKLADEKPTSPVTRTVSIGDKGKRANTHLISLFVAIAHNNFALRTNHNVAKPMKMSRPSAINSGIWF